MVREVNERAGMPVDRIARVTSYGFGDWSEQSTAT
jgi:hypothetical protein